MWIFWIWIIVTCIASGVFIHGDITYGGSLTVRQVVNSIVFSMFWLVWVGIVIWYWYDENSNIPSLGKYWDTVMDYKIVKGKNS